MIQQYHSYLRGTVTGFLLGFFLLHPFSMVLQHPAYSAPWLDFSVALKMFALNHMSMALFFGVLGAVFGVLTVLLNRQKKRADILEGLLPICSYCRRVRDDHGLVDTEVRWHNVETYIVKKTETKLTHGICPECREKVMEQTDPEKVDRRDK